MRYHIDTIPVWDAARKDPECIFCALRVKAEADEADRFLGASVMEPDVRIKVNRLGFCARHQQMLYRCGNRLGHALMMQTHLHESAAAANECADRMVTAAEKAGSATLARRISGKAKDAREALRAAADEIAALSGSCILCASVEETMGRWAHTFFHLYQHDAEFRKTFENGKGVCLPDLALLLRTAAEELPAKEAAAFARTAAELQRRKAERMQEDIDWFVKKYDYRYTAEPWKNSRDAVERTVNLLRGACIGEDAQPEKK